MVQLKVWSWVNSKARGVSFLYSDWFLEPVVCMKSIKKMLGDFFMRCGVL